jgi:hypothetical protein
MTAKACSLIVSNPNLMQPRSGALPCKKLSAVLPYSTRALDRGIARWDAYPVVLAVMAEVLSRGVEFPLRQDASSLDCYYPTRDWGGAPNEPRSTVNDIFVVER